MSYTSCPAFEHYYEPETVEETVALLARWGKDARLLAGGTVLINRMRTGAISAKHVINMRRIASLARIGIDEGELSIGATTKLADVAKSPLVQQRWPLVAQAVQEIGVAQTRNLGTVVGNICRATAASADAAVAFLALDAAVVLTGAKVKRRVPMAQFLARDRGAMAAEGELVTEVRVPPQPAGTRTAFVNVDRAKVNVAVLLLGDGKAWTDVRIALGGAAPTPVRSPRAENVLIGKPANAALFRQAGEAAAADSNPDGDIRFSAEYRRHLIGVLACRALEAATAAK